MKDELIAQFELTKADFERLKKRVDPLDVGKPKYKMAKEFILLQLDKEDYLERKRDEKRKKKLIKEGRKLKGVE